LGSIFFFKLGVAVLLEVAHLQEVVEFTHALENVFGTFLE
jgi:hypothetical protein